MRTSIGLAAVGVLVGATLIGSHQASQLRKTEVAQLQAVEDTWSHKLAAERSNHEAQLAAVHSKLLAHEARLAAERNNHEAQLAAERSKLLAMEEELRYDLTAMPDEVIASFSSAEQEMYMKLCSNHKIPCRLQDEGAALLKGDES